MLYNGLQFNEDPYFRKSLLRSQHLHLQLCINRLYLSVCVLYMEEVMDSNPNSSSEPFLI